MCPLCEIQPPITTFETTSTHPLFVNFVAYDPLNKSDPAVLAYQSPNKPTRQPVLLNLISLITQSHDCIPFAHFATPELTGSS